MVVIDAEREEEGRETDNGRRLVENVENTFDAVEKRTKMAPSSCRHLIFLWIRCVTGRSLTKKESVGVDECRNDDKLFACNAIMVHGFVVSPRSTDLLESGILLPKLITSIRYRNQNYETTFSKFAATMATTKDESRNATAAANNNNEAQTIPLDSMSLEELNQVEQQEQGRLQMLSNRYGQLRQAAARLAQSSKAVSQLSQAAKEQQNDGESGNNNPHEIMVPLTESVYVPGKIVNADSLLVELGTGYYAEQSSDEALAFLERKKKLVDANSDNVMQAIQATKQNIQSLNVAMQGKLLEIRAKQEGQRIRATAEG